MPFQDLPCQGERSAPILNITHPLSIKRYFDRLEFLFLKHSISDTQEKKLAAVMYHSEAEIEELWRTAFAFSDPTCSYEDFKEEIIELYPEVEAAQPTLEELETLVAARTHSQIRSEQELGEYNRKFITISRFLISKNRLGLAEQERYFFAGFEPVLAMAVRSRLKRILPDHLPADPYKVEDIYKAALYILRWQRHAPCVQVPWILSPAFPTPATPATAIPTLLQQVSAFPLAPQSPSPAQPDPVAAVHKTTWKCLAPLISALRDEPRASTAIPVTSIPISLLPPAAHLFQPALQFGQADIPTSTPIECSIVSAQPLSNKAKPLTAQRTEAKNPVKKAPLQLTCVPEEEEARPEKRPQGPVPIIEAHGPAEPSGIASEVLGSPSEDPTAQTSFSGPEYGIDRPKHQPAPIPIIEAHGPAAPSGIAPEVLGSPSEDLTAPPSFSGVECSILRPKHHSAPASVIETHSDCEARIVTASISNTTDNPSSVSDPSSTCDPTCKIPSVPPGLSIGITPSTSALEAHTLAIPSEVSFSTRITLWLLVLLAGYASLSLSVHSLISTNVQVSTPLSTYSDSASSITKVPPPSSVFASIPHPASISPSISDPICIPPLSMRFSVSDPECPQLANQVPNTPKAIRSRPRWPRSQVSQLVSVHMRQRAQRPPQASSHTPLPYFLYFIGRCDERHSAEPSDNWLTTRCRETAWKLLFHPRKPPDIVQAAPTIFGHAHMTEDSHFFSWEENQVPDGMKVISTRIGIDQIVTLNACDTLGRSLRLRQYPPLTKCFAFDPGGPDHGPGWSQFRPQGISSGETELQQQCIQQRGLGFTRSDSRQVITSPGQLSAMAQSRDCSRFARRLRTVSLISSSAYKSRGIVHKEAQGNIIRSTSAWMGLRPQGLSNYATFTRTSAARPKFGDGLRYLRHHLQPPQRRVQEVQVYLTKSDMYHRVPQEQVQRRQHQHSADLDSSAMRKEHHHAPTIKFATSAVARRQPTQLGFTRSSILRATSIIVHFTAMPTAPQSRGLSIFDRVLRAISHVYRSDYRFRSDMHEGMQYRLVRSTSAKIRAQVRGFRGSAICARTPAALPKIGKSRQYLQQRFLFPRRRAQDPRISFGKSSQEQLGIVTRVASTSVPQACGCSRHVLRPTTARGDHNNKYNNHSDLRSTCRPTRQKRHKPRSLGKYKYSSNCTGIAQTSAVYASVWTGSRSRQQCFQGAQVCAQQEQLSDRRRSLRAALPRFATLVHCCTTIARTSAARLGDDDDHAFKRTHFQLPRHHARQIRLDPKYQHSSADPDGLHCPQGFPRHQSTSNPYCPVLPSALFLRAPMTEDSQDLSWERIIRPVHGWPGKVPLWSLSRTAPAARSIPTLRPTLSSFPRFGRLSALSHASAASAYYNYIPFGYPLWFGYLASVVPYIPYTLD
ncbi:hypothetical protein BJY52DRAFT_1192920 [Lactarius psammicola]|nr:hypothetical protein BJY52DRAFT_1192920 [Lactarius psammicola]